MDEPLEMVLDCFCCTRNVSGDAHLTVDGGRIKQGDTPEDHVLDDGDEVWVVLEQQEGAAAASSGAAKAAKKAKPKPKAKAKAKPAEKRKQQDPSPRSDPAKKGSGSAQSKLLRELEFSCPGAKMSVSPGDGDDDSGGGGRGSKRRSSLGGATSEYTAKNNEQPKAIAAKLGAPHPCPLQLRDRFRLTECFFLR